MTAGRSIIPVGKIETRILLIRGEIVIVDADLADFYSVPTKRLHEPVKRNANRFPLILGVRLPRVKNQNWPHIAAIDRRPQRVAAENIEN